MNCLTERGLLYDLNAEFLTRAHYCERNGQLFLEPEDVRRRLPIKAFLLPEGHTLPFQVTLLPLPPDLCTKESCPYIGERRLRRNVTDIRADLRVDVELTALAGLQVPTQEVRVLDLSSGGLLAVTTGRYDLGTTLVVQLPLTDQEDRPLPLTLRATIRNRMPVMLEAGRQALGYGCQFLHLDEADEEALRRYVFQTELEQRRRLQNA